MSTNRLIWVDLVKGICIISVVFFHFCQNYKDNLEAVDFLGIQSAKLGFAAVDIFFVLAGFNLSYSLASIEEKKQINWSNINWFDWLKKKFIRLYPAYWLAFFIIILLYLLFNRPIQFNSVLNTLFLLLGLNHYNNFKIINPGFWFFCVIVQAFLTVPLIFYLTAFKPKKILSLGILVGILNKILLGILLIYEREGFWYNWFLQNNFISSYFFQFCLGLYWGFNFYRKRIFSKQDFRYSYFLGGIAVAIYFLAFIIKIDIVYKTGIDICVTPCLFLLLYYLANIDYFQKQRPYNISFFLSKIGVNSYEIYLLHQPLFFVLFPLIIKNLHLSYYGKLLCAIPVILCLLFLYVVCLIELEKLVKKYIFKLR